MRLVLGLACVLALPALAAPQSLGDAARKERERREAVEKNTPPVRTVTDEDLAANKGEVANRPEPARVEPPQDDEGRNPDLPPDSVKPLYPITAERKGAPQESPEDYWRGRVAAAQERIARAEGRHMSLQRQIHFGQPRRYNENGQVVIYSQQTMKERADAAEAELLAAKQALEDLYDEARRAGALPGWLR